MKRERPKGTGFTNEVDRTETPTDSAALWFLGQSGFIAKGGGSVVYFDPYLSDYLDRFTKGRPDEDPRRFIPPVSPGDVTNADIVFGSHWHYDHIDPGAVGVIADTSPSCTFVVPPVAKHYLIGYGIPEERIVAPPVDKSHTLGGVTFTCVPTAHETLDYDDTFGYPYYSYAVTIGGVTIYHAGDCIPYDGLVERLKPLGIDIALLPINGRDYFRLNRGFDGNFTYREAAELANAIDADLLIPMHFGMHMSNTERPGYLVDFLHERFPLQKCHIMTPGEGIVYMKNGLTAL